MSANEENNSRDEKDQQSQNVNENEVRDDNLIADSGDILGRYSDEEYKQVLDEASAEVDHWLEYAKDKTNFSEIKSQATELKEKIKARFLKKEDNESLNQKIDSFIADINEKQNEERDKMEEVFSKNYEGIKDKVKEIVDAAYKAENFREARESLLNLQSELKEIKLRKSHKEAFQDDINDAFQNVVKRQSEERENYEMECIENYHNLKSKVDEAVKFADTSTNYGQARQKFIKIQSDIKGKSLRREQREELYQTIRDNFEAINTRQESERDEYLTLCKNNFEKLQIVVNEAIEFAKTTEDYTDARQRLINAQSEIKGVKLTRDQRDKLYGDIREVFTNLNEQQSGEREDFEKEANENYDKISNKINEAYELVHGVTDFRLIRETLISIQGEIKIMRLKRDQRNELFGRIREAFLVFDKKKR